jgi:predicted dehydrogenase
MNLSPAIRAIGRRNFLKAMGGASALAALGTTAVMRGPKRGGPVRTAIIGFGDQGRRLLGCANRSLMQITALCDIRPGTTKVIMQSGGAQGYQDWRRMIRDESPEAVLIATPTWTHAEIATSCLEAGLHVFCEPPMALDETQCTRMLQASLRNRRTLHVGYQDFYQTEYWAAYSTILKQGLLGDVYTAISARHTWSSGRMEVSANQSQIDVRPWGYGSLDELMNWRLYRRFSGGLMAEWGGEIVSLLNWCFGAQPNRVQASGGLESYDDGRDVADHLYTILEYPQDRIATLSLIRSNGFEGSYTQFMGTKGTLIFSAGEALLFAELGQRPATVGAVNPSQPLLDASASRNAEAANHSAPTYTSEAGAPDRLEAIRAELAAFCGAIRSHAPLRCQPAQAGEVARTCFAVEEAVANNILTQRKRAISLLHDRPTGRRHA